jgi:peptide/nickel transport system substrate-binding protein
VTVERRPPNAAAGVTRQELLRAAGAGAFALSAGNLLAACGGGSSSSGTSAATTAAGPVKRGGTLRAGFGGGNNADTLDAINPINHIDFARIYQLYDELVAFDKDAKPQMALAESITPNASATEWTIRLRPGVTWHNGKDFGADDVIHTFETIMNPKSPGPGASAMAAMDVAGIKKLDKLTLRIPFKTPYAPFIDTLPCYYYHIIPVGYDPKNPVGTGPYKYKSFTPGQQSVFTKNENYWQSGLPYTDEVVITDYADETSQINALVGGQADVVDLLTSDAINSVQSGGGNILISSGGGWTPFTMRVDAAPFNDVRVRQAMRLAVDRKQMLDLLFGGNGTLGNDVFGIWDPEYDHALPQREQDLEQAKSLLKQAGHEGLSVQLVTGPIAQGTVKAAQVLAQQATGAGMNINLRQVTVTEFYGNNYLKWVFAQDYWTYDPYLPQVGFATIKTSPFNETHFNDPQYTKLYREGLATLDAAKRKQILAEMQRIDYDRGGYIIPFFPPVIDGYSKKVNGDVQGKTGWGFNTYDLKRLWLS